MANNTILDLTAIHIGITSQKWEYMYENDPIDECKEFMAKKRYDILPLKNPSGNFNHFMVTDSWNNFNKIEKRSKSELPKLKADSEFMSLLQAFISNEDKYFLLYKGANIVGLIAVANFSFREIYIRLYHSLAEFEILLSDWIFNFLEQDDVFNILLKKNESQNTKAVLGQYLIDQRMGKDGPLKEYIFLSSLHNIIKEKKLFAELGFSKAEWNAIGDPLMQTRNSVAHPVRSIIREKNDFNRVLISLNAIKRITSKLRSTPS